jgi:fibronectin type 3 domain-containing protein
VSTLRLAATGVILASVAVPLAATSASAVTPSPTLVYAADLDGDSVAGLYRATVADPTNKTAIMADDGMVSVVKAVLSPDGSRIAVLVDLTSGATADSGASTLMTMNLDGTNRHALVKETQSFPAGGGAVLKNVSGISWKNNDTILYGWDQATFTPPSSFTSSSEFKTVSAAGGTATTLAGTNGYSQPALSPDGSKIVAVQPPSAATSGAMRIVAFSAADTTVAPTVIATDAANQLTEPVWSPNSTAVAFSRYKPMGANNLDATEIDVARFDAGTSSWGSATVQVPAVQTTSQSWIDQDLVWFDDTTLAFERIDDSSTTAMNSSIPIDLWTAVFNAGTSSFDPATKFANTPTVDEWSATVAAADTTAPSPVTFTPFSLGGTSVTLHWTTPDADYSHVVLHRNDGVNPQVDIDHVTGTSYVDQNLALGTTYSYTATTWDGAGNHVEQVDPAHSVTPLNAPKIVVASPTSTSWHSLPFNVKWAVTNPTATPYTVSYATKTGATWALSSPHAWQSATSAGSAPFKTGVAGQTYYFQATNGDAFGNIGASPWTGANVPYDQVIGTYSKGWTTLSNATAYWLGSLRSTGLSGASWSTSATSKSLSLIGEKCPTCGSFKVYIDGHLKGTYSSKATTSKHRQVLWTGANTTISKHTFKVVAVLAKGQVLRVDGLADPR